MLNIFFGDTFVQELTEEDIKRIWNDILEMPDEISISDNTDISEEMTLPF